MLPNVNKDIWVPSPPESLLTFSVLHKSRACVLSQCGESQSHAEASPRAVETPQALRATGRNDAVKAVSACSREPEVPSVTID